MVTPRRMNSVPSVMMNDGSRCAARGYPLKTPNRRAKASDASIASQMFQPYSTLSSAKIMPQAPIIEPIERSNSPPIISSATATARMPSWAATSR